MIDTTFVKTFQVIGNNDTVNYSVNKEIVEYFTKEKPTDYSHYIEVLIPVFVIFLTLILTKLFDFWTENRKYKKDFLKENRKQKIHFLKYLNNLKTSLAKPLIPDADINDFKEWIADRMVGINPFEDLNINSNIIFNGNNALIEHINRLFNNAETIRNEFKWNGGKHPSASYTIAKDINDELGLVIEQIADNLN